MKSFIAIVLLGALTISFGERNLVIDAKDGRIIKKVSSIDSIKFGSSDPVQDLVLYSSVGSMLYSSVGSITKSLTDIDSITFITSATAPDTACTDSLLAQGHYVMGGCGGMPMNENEWVCRTPEALQYYTTGELENRQPIYCPICLDENTEIATPSGPVNVQKIKPGMFVWSHSAGGQKIAVPVLIAASTPVLKTHKVVHITLEDGRELFVSPGHPGFDGRDIETFVAGDEYNGVLISKLELVPYTGKKTWDLLPESPTGLYWANGILMGSTLIFDGEYAQSK